MIVVFLILFFACAPVCPILAQDQALDDQSDTRQTDTSQNSDVSEQGEEPQDPHLDFVHRVYAALNDPDDKKLDAVLQAEPYRALVLIHDLMYNASCEPENPYILEAAHRIAGRASACLGSTAGLEAIARFESLAPADRAKRRQFEIVLGDATRAFHEGRIEEARDRAMQTSEIADLLIEPFLKARVFRLLGRIEEASGNREKAGAHYRNALNLDQSLQLITQLVWDYCYLGDMEFKAGAHAAALKWYYMALPHAKTVGDRLAESILTANMGALLSFLGRYHEAEQVLTRALKLSRWLEDKPREAYVLSAWGTLKSGMGDYAEAIRLLIDASAAWQAAGDASREAGSLLDLAGVYSEVGQMTDAEDCIARALERLPEDSGPRERARAMVTQGLCDLDTGRFAEAVALLDRAVSLLEGHPDAALAEALKHRATSLLHLGDLDEAGKTFTKALNLNVECGNRYSAVLCLIGLGKVLFLQERFAEAKGTFEDALEKAKEMGLPELMWRASYRLGLVAESSGRNHAAMQHYLDAIAEVEKMRRLLFAPALLERYLGDKLSLYRRAARHAAKQGRIEKAFELAEAGKARTRLRLSAGQTPAASGRHDLIDALREKEAELNLLERRITESLQQAGGDDARDELRQRLKGARAEHKALRIQCQLSAPRSIGLIGLGEPPTPGDVMSSIGPNEALLEYLAGPDGVDVFVITENQARFVTLAKTGTQAEEWVTRILEPMEQLKQGNVDLANLHFDAGAAHELYNLLIAPIKKDLKGCFRVHMLRDGFLRKLPFALLVSKYEKRRVDPTKLFSQYRGCQFLIEEMCVSYLPSASLLKNTSELTKRSHKVKGVILADPDPIPLDAESLPGSRTEAQAALKCLGPKRVKLFSGSAATEAAVKGLKLAPEFLHLACHASLNDRRPSYSRLALAPGLDEDGWLHAFEVARLTINAKLVVLSACESIGSQGRGEGLLGLCRAFLQSGASSVVASSWIVDDEATALLMTRFYHSLSEGQSPGLALQSAQRFLLRKGTRNGMDLIHPFFWAGFMHTGWNSVSYDEGKEK